MCTAPVVGKCGTIVSHHWAHIARPDCDEWASESAWHLGWKRYLAAHAGASLEVPMERSGMRHRADAVVGSGLVVELQATYLSAESIHAREAFYGRMVWIYNGDLFADRIHWGRWGFWIKHGPKSLAEHQRPVFVASPSGRRFLHITSLSIVDGRMLGKGLRMNSTMFMDHICRMAGSRNGAAA